MQLLLAELCFVFMLFLFWPFSPSLFITRFFLSSEGSDDFQWVIPMIFVLILLLLSMEAQSTGSDDDSIAAVEHSKSSLRLVLCVIP